MSFYYKEVTSARLVVVQYYGPAEFRPMHWGREVGLVDVVRRY